MDGWGEVCRIQATARTPAAQSKYKYKPTPGIASLAFDNSANLLWCGDSEGYSASFTPPPEEPQTYTAPGPRHVPLYKYTRFRSSRAGAAAALGQKARDCPITQLVSHSRGVLSLSPHSLGFNHRRGAASALVSAGSLAEKDAAGFRDLKCMALAYPTSNDVIVGGEASLLKLDLVRPATVQYYDHPGRVYGADYSSKLLTLNTGFGSLELFDPASNRRVQAVAAHAYRMYALDVKGNYVVTCGSSQRTSQYGGQYGHASSAFDFDAVDDPLVKIYDLRTMRALPSLTFPAGARHVRFHPKLPNIVVMASESGLIQFVDIHSPQIASSYQADLGSGALRHLELSENGEFLCFSDSFQNMHLWSMSSSTSRSFSNFPAVLDQPDITDNTVASRTCVGLDDPVPLNSVGLPFYKDYLASNYPAEMVFTKDATRVPQPVSEAAFVPENTQYRDHTWDRTLTRYVYDKATHGPRYVVAPYTALNKTARTKAGPHSAKPTSVPKFISERSMTASPVPGSRPSDSPSLPAFATFHDFNDIDADGTVHANGKSDGNDFESDPTFQYKPEANTQVPPCYNKLAIRYSKFGVDDFDFDYYNRSGGQLAGLENHLDNSYANALLQVYRYTPIFYNTVIKSLMSEYLPNDQVSLRERGNPQGTSVLNELGYLLDMMHKAGARSVSIANFSSILSESSINKNYGLLNRDDGKSLNAKELQLLILAFNKFLVESIVDDFGNQFSIDIHDLTAIHYQVEYFMPSGELIEKQQGSEVTLDLCSPAAPKLSRAGFGNNAGSRFNSQHPTKKNNTILNYLDFSLNNQRTIPASPKEPFEVEARQSLLGLGPVLSINLPFSNHEFDHIRGCKKWLLPEFYTTTGPNRKVVFKPVIAHMNQRADKYELQGYVCEVSHGPLGGKGQHNLVSYVKIKSAASGKDQWFLFNDFLVMPIPEEEVFNLSYHWKKPVVVVYSNSEDPRNQTFSYLETQMFRRISSLNDAILYRDHFAYGIRKGYKKEYELLTRQEAPEVGTLVAIDAEFVSLRPEVVEISYTGAKNVVRPTQLSLARVSALRGSPGPKHGVPLIDDYIMHCKPIYNYLTTFSGIEDGDLDPTRSLKTLVTLQTAYRRLWLLLNLGCVFVGHGLKGDFRCINLQVPRAQIRDTIEYYYLPDFRRKLSLKFLAYTVLKESVQTQNHDSIEDARTALRLYERYTELKAAGEFEQALRRVYSEGQQLRFRVPE